MACVAMPKKWLRLLIYVLLIHQFEIGLRHESGRRRRLIDVFTAEYTFASFFSVYATSTSSPWQPGPHRPRPRAAP
jgi:hypothetical protein